MQVLHFSVRILGTSYPIAIYCPPDVGSFHKFKWSQGFTVWILCNELHEIDYALNEVTCYNSVLVGLSGYISPHFTHIIILILSS